MKIKKLFALLLAATMTFTMTATAFAEPSVDHEQAVTTKGSITIKNAIDKEEYDLYRIFELESFNSKIEGEGKDAKDVGPYAYKVLDSDWGEFAYSSEEYVAVDDQGYVTWEDGADAAKFAKLALEYAQENKITPDATVTANGNVVEFSELPLGYYLIDSSVGALCSLDTTNLDITMEEKNSVPSIKKEVYDEYADVDKTEEKWGATNTAKIGDVVEFKATVTAQPGAENYEIHDKMDDGLTFIGIVSVKCNDKLLDKENDFELLVNPNDKVCDKGCTFELKFTQDYCDTLKADDKIVVTYRALVNEKAVVAGDGNQNEVVLKYGDDNWTVEQTTETYTYSFDLVKTTDKYVTVGEGEKAYNTYSVLTGAKFELYDAKEEGNLIPLVKEDNGIYRLATGNDMSESGFESADIEAGRVTIKGLSKGVYYLEETLAPAGYNKLAERVEVEIVNKNEDATFENDLYVSDGIHVKNSAGTLLPSTGGIGTTLFYVIGGVLVLAAVALLVLKSRMKTEN